jgi:GT2 family glycosyltransferase
VKTQIPSPPRPIDIVIPFYRNADLVAPLFHSITAVAGELAALGCSLVIINDSPADAVLRTALDEAARGLPPGLACERIENSQNQGFIRSANTGLRLALARQHDVILLNSDTLLFPGAISEMRHVADLDTMIGFVSPRSNNATICSLPHQDECKHMPPEKAYSAFKRLAPHLRDFQFVPAAVGFCLLIKVDVLAEFGLLDECYGPGYNEENDLIMRANRCGYRAALANHAFVYHIGERSFAEAPVKAVPLREKNTAILRNRYPEYHPSVNVYAAGSHYLAEHMLSALLPDRDGHWDVVFDLSGLGPCYNGTFAATRQVITRAVKQWSDVFNVYLMASPEAIRFHRLDKIGTGTVSFDTTRTFAAAFRYGQPYEWQQMARLSNLGVVNVYAMLDPISLDCLYLNMLELEELWAGVFGYADAVIYISDFVADQFHRRFRIRPGLREVVSYLSLDLRDYAAPAAVASPGDHILVVGNAFHHKRVKPTAEALHRAFPEEKIVALGLDEPLDGVATFSSGYLPEGTVKNLLRDAKFVVFPSSYEGFGFPVLESLAFRKPILARDIPVIRAIREKLRANDNLILFTSTGDLIRRLQNGFPVWKQPAEAYGESAECANWDSITRDLGKLCQELIASVSVEDVLEPRLRYFRFLAPGTGQSPPNATALMLTLRDREAQLAEMHNAWSWRITAPLRILADAYFRLRHTKAPEGPRRR